MIIIIVLYSHNSILFDNLTIDLVAFRILEQIRFIDL